MKILQLLIMTICHKAESLTRKEAGRNRSNKMCIYTILRISMTVITIQFVITSTVPCLMLFLFPPGEGALCSIPIENILAVERLEEESFKMKNVRNPLWALVKYLRVWAFGPKSLLQVFTFLPNLHSFLPTLLLQMFQVIQPERALYIQANNCVEARDWIDILTKVSQCNRKRLSTYHPSAYLNGHWLCCKLSADTAPGCTPCTGYIKLLTSAQLHIPVLCFRSLSFHARFVFFSGLPANIQLDVDGDRETERIYSLFSTYMTKLIKMQG